MISVRWRHNTNQQSQCLATDLLAVKQIALPQDYNVEYESPNHHLADSIIIKLRENIHTIIGLKPILVLVSTAKFIVLPQGSTQKVFSQPSLDWNFLYQVGAIQRLYASIVKYTNNLNNEFQVTLLPNQQYKQNWTVSL